MKYIFLSDQFYIDYAHCTEIEKKQTRPYVHVFVKLFGKVFAIPLRSNISHRHAFWTDKPNRCGLDFSKTVVIEDSKYMDTTEKPYIRPHEHKALLGKTREIERKLMEYIKKYKNAKANPNNHDKRNLLKFSTLQYFEECILVV